MLFSTDKTDKNVNGGEEEKSLKTNKVLLPGVRCLQQQEAGENTQHLVLLYLRVGAYFSYLAA